MPTTVTATRGGADQDVDITYADQQARELAQGPANDRRPFGPAAPTPATAHAVMRGAADGRPFR